MEAGAYTEPRSHHDVKAVDSATEALLINTFSAPLPYVGSTLSGLKEYPAGLDQIATRDTSFPHHYTSWNFQNHVLITSFFTRVPPAPQLFNIRTPPTTPTRRHITVLADGVLEQVMRHDMCITARNRTRLTTAQAWIDTTGRIHQNLPKNARFRSALLPAGEALLLASSVGAPVQVPLDLEEVCGGEHNADEFEVVDAPEEPTERSKINKIPARTVIPRYTSFQSTGPVSPPLSSVCQQMMALTNTTDKAATQPLLNTVRSPLARDLPSMQMLAAYSSSSNGSHIDTAPVVRGILYASAAYEDMFELDRTTNHFLRRENLAHPPAHVRHVHDWPGDVRVRVRLIAVTLPAYTNHLKGHDAALAGAGWSVQSMDQTWCAVPQYQRI